MEKYRVNSLFYRIYPFHQFTLPFRIVNNKNINRDESQTDIVFQT